MVNLSCWGRWEEPCRVQEGEQSPAPPMPHFLGCDLQALAARKGLLSSLGSEDAFTHWSFGRGGYP